MARSSEALKVNAAPTERPLYERDAYGWAMQQAELIRAGRFSEVDVGNLVEEIESLGRSERSQLRERMQTLIEHLLKLEASHSIDPRRGWRETVHRSRRAVDRLLRDNPSLRGELPVILQDELESTARFTARLLEEAGESSAAIYARLRAGGLTLDEVFGDWLPESP